MSQRDGKRRPSFGTPGTRASGSRARSAAQYNLRPTILIVCEGTKTEPSYFSGFRVTNHVYGKGFETIRVVEEAKRLSKAKGPFDQVWCVFDRDGFPPDDYDNAIRMVEDLGGQGFRVAYSNEAFELWYLLHFEYFDARITRDRYNEKLAEHLGQKYRKGDASNYDLIQEKGDEALAIRHAQRLQGLYGSAIPHSQRCPVTTVDKLVVELRRIQSQRR